MGKRIEYKKGDVIGQKGCIFICEVVSHIRPGGSIERMAKFQCHCGNNFITSISEVKRGNATSCGCSLRIKYKECQLIGDNGLIYLYEVDPYIAPGDGKKSRRAMFECGYCGNIFETETSKAISGHTTSCGCEQRRRASAAKRKHGMSDTKIHHTWKDIKSRCYRERDTNYHRYGGRGIRVCEEWRDDFQAFYDYVSKLEHYGEPGYTIDRIENDGNYEPGNVRWATAHQQNTNQRTQKNNTSGYVGIYFDKNKQKWIASIGVHGNSIYIGAYNTIEEAVTARNNYIIENGLTEYKIQELKIES